MQKIKVTKTGAGKRLDVFLSETINQLNRSYITKLVDESKVLVNSTSVKAGYKLKAGDTVEVKVDLKKLGKTEKIKLPIIYEDKDCLVIDKPAGVLTHSKGSFNPEGSVASFIKEHVARAPHADTGQVESEKRTKVYKKYSGGVSEQSTKFSAASSGRVASSASEQANAVWWSGNRAGIVHRLDRGTSGVIICAKTPETLKWLQKQFSTRKTKKTYVAVVSGKPDQDSAVIDMPIERHPRRPQTFRTSPTGRPAITEYKVLKSVGDKSLLELKPQTGRTHQLRVHLSKIGHPIVGDTLYGGEEADRVYLHAVSLELTLPSKQRKVFESPLPDSFDAILET